MSQRQERIASNETTFRSANEQLARDFDRIGLEPDRLAVFVCECGNRGCTEVIRLSPAEYEAVRADAHTFAVLPGHEDDDTEAVVTADVVERNDRFAVVRKRADYRSETGATDPR